jgi:hypothetical protein
MRRGSCRLPYPGTTACGCWASSRPIPSRTVSVAPTAGRLFVGAQFERSSVIEVPDLGPSVDPMPPRDLAEVDSGPCLVDPRLTVVAPFGVGEEVQRGDQVIGIHRPELWQRREVMSTLLAPCRPTLDARRTQNRMPQASRSWLGAT